MNKTHFDRMIAAGLIDGADLTEADEELINSLSTDEVEAMLRMENKPQKRSPSAKGIGAVVF